MSDWLRPDEAAAWLRTSVGNIRVLAHRGRWRRQWTGSQVAYHIDDVQQELLRRDTRQRAAQRKESL